MKTVVALGHDGMGHGDAELGRRILATFLRKALAIRGLTAIVLFNAGAKLVTPSSPVIAELRALHEHGVDIRPCGTCIDAFNLRDQIAVGAASNMDEIIAEMDRADKVVTL